MKYLVLAMRTAQFDAAQGPDHHAFLHQLREKGQLEQTGPFTNGTGGAYVIIAENLEAATQIVHQDPLHVSGSSEMSIYEWKAS